MIVKLYGIETYRRYEDIVGYDDKTENPADPKTVIYCGSTQGFANESIIVNATALNVHRDFQKQLEGGK